MAVQAQSSHSVVSLAPGAHAASRLPERFAPLIRGLSGMVPLAGEPRDLTTVHAPFTGEALGTVPVCTADDVRLAAGRARAAQLRWAARSLAERRRVFLRYHDLVLERQESLLDLVQIEGGKARRHAIEEVYDTALNARYYAQHAGDYVRPRRRQAFVPLLAMAWEVRHPVGLVGIIAPWNYPLTMAVSDAIPALLAGNAVVLKPAELTPFSALYAVMLLYEAGLPADLFQVVTGRGRELGTPLIRESDFIGFTGSTAVGRVVAQQAGDKLIKASLELGGKNPMIVLNDADLDRAVHGAIQGSFSNAGQLCVSFERVYAQSGIYQRFLDAFVRRTRALRLGASLDYAADVGSLISRDQLDKTLAHLDDAVAKGATLLAGGRARPDIGPFFFEPAILSGVTPVMRCYREETFGPVVAVYRVETAEEAAAAANDSEYGLNASVWTRDLRCGRMLAQRIRCGTVNVNEAYSAAWSALGAPMGGMRNSGPSRRHGAEGIQKYTDSQTVAIAPLGPLFPPFGLDVELTAQLLPKVLRAMKHIPGLR